VAVDPNAARRQRILNTLNPGASRSWTTGSGANQISYTVSNVQLRTLHGTQVLSVDLLVSRAGVVWFADRINLPNPVQAVRNNSGVPVDNPLIATRNTLQDIAFIVTQNFTVVHDMRDGAGGFIGDTLAVRSSTADGVLTSTNATWNTARDGSGLVADTSSNGATPAVNTGFTVRLLFLDFDTSSLGQGATITALVPTLYGASIAETNTNSTEIECKILDWGGALTTADWPDLNPDSNWTALTTVAARALSGWQQTNGTANNLTDAGLAYDSINKTSPTYMVVGLARIAIGQPTGNNQFPTWQADTAGTSSDPLLTVTYTPGKSPVLFSRPRRIWTARSMR
jgi:hypothetical protein